MHNDDFWSSVFSPAAQRSIWLEECSVQRLCNWRSNRISWYVTWCHSLRFFKLKAFLMCAFFFLFQLVWRLGSWDVEALLHSPLPLNIICGEPLKSGSMDKSLTDAHLDEPKRTLWIFPCTWRIAAKAEQIRLLFVYSELKQACLCFFFSYVLL